MMTAAKSDLVHSAEPETWRTRLLVVGDDPAIVELLCVTLRSVGYQVRAAGAGSDAATAGEAWEPDVMVQDGFKITRMVRGHRRSVPAIFLTPGDQLKGRLPGLTIGGGDYVTKPFSPEELTARIRAVLRRTRAASEGVLRFADLELEEDTYDVRRAGKPILLTPTEFTLLGYLMRNAGKVVTRPQILDHLWPYGYTGNPQVVETYILRLRRKIDRVGPPLIHTRRGFGYSLRLPRG